MKEKLILKSAKNLFSKYGFKKVSMDEVALEAGVTKKTVYSYFPSKEELLKSILKKELEKMKSDLESIEKEENDIFETLHKAIFNLMKYRSQNNLFKMLFNEADIFNNRNLKENLKVIEEDIISYIKLKLSEAVEEGKIEVQNIDIMSFLIYKMYIALMFEWNDSYKKVDEEAVANNILNVLKNGIERK